MANNNKEEISDIMAIQCARVVREFCRRQRECDKTKCPFVIKGDTCVNCALSIVLPSDWSVDYGQV